MPSKIKYAFFFLLGLASSSVYFLLNFESISLAPLTLEVVIKKDSYSIGDNVNTNVVTLIDDIRNGTKYEPIILLEADKTISYFRVAETMDILKNEGYKTVGLVSND
jgi:biopolymer transport protein ExbD